VTTLKTGQYKKAKPVFKIKNGKMKKLLFLLLIVLVSSSTIFSQTKKGNFELSGGTGLQFISSNLKFISDGTTTDKTTMSSLSFLPSFGYFIIDNLAIGLAGNITTNTQKYEDGDKDVSTSTLIFPAALYYFPIAGKIRPIAQIGVGLASQTQKYVPKTGSNEKNSASGIAFNFGGGISYFMKENISINLGLSYTLANLTDSDDNTSKLKEGNFGSNIGFSIFF
jgi:outer membrane protein